MLTETLIKPTLLLDEQRCKINIERMCRKANDQGVVLRPHFKTHQSKLIGRFFRDLNIDKITVSSVGMARYFAADNWRDITIAFPVNIRQMEEIQDLSARVRLGLLVVDAPTVEVLGKHLDISVSVWIKIDVGTHRTGISPKMPSVIEDILARLMVYPHLVFEGFMAHAGHSYHSRTRGEVQSIYDDALNQLLQLKHNYISTFPDIKISLGDTPGASMVDKFGPVDELRPGNFVFYDLMQEQIGACTLDDIAVTMACPVVAVHPDRKQWIIYGGAIHFSKDYLTLDDGRKCFGRMVGAQGTSWTVDHSKHHPEIISLSQEHGIVQCSDDNFDLCKPGDISLWLPVHSCLTADVMGGYMDLQGNLIDHYRQRTYSL